jgi:predicted regulator of Ras-like GTPase activity (Roadblock/LC7/MglB family)
MGLGTIVEHLRLLRDVQGVYGSFVVAGSGSLVDRDLPDAFDETLLAEVGPRIARMFETFSTDAKDMETCMLRYAEHKLFVRKMTWGLIGVISSAAVNLPALRMVVNLVVRRIDPEVSAIYSSQSASRTPPPLPVVTPSARPPSVSASPPSARPRSPTPAPPPVAPAAVGDGDPPPTEHPVRMYRGRPVVDE